MKVGHYRAATKLPLLAVKQQHKVMGRRMGLWFAGPNSYKACTDCTHHTGRWSVVDQPLFKACGGLRGGLAKSRGIRGMIVDGAERDIDELEDIGWPIWTRAIVPRGTHTMFSNRKEELSINVPIACGGVTVNPGDFIIADTIGVTVVPLQRAEEILACKRAGRTRTKDS
jgi:hypothetical protein